MLTLLGGYDAEGAKKVKNALEALKTAREAEMEAVKEAQKQEVSAAFNTAYQ